MICAGKVCVYAVFLGLFIGAQNTAAFGKEDKDTRNTDPGSVKIVNDAARFQWCDHKKLSWDDFRGPVSDATDEYAAATHCGIGFKTCNSDACKPVITVYNTFYINKSWVRSDAKIAEILVHEQGHFDLCEIYTRKLRALMNDVDCQSGNMKLTLMKLYDQVSEEYENRQQAYERETTHGINFPEQKRWVDMIASELNTSPSGQFSANYR
jgi:hypothetical protein